MVGASWTDQSAAAHLLRAKVHSALHRFGQAEAAIKQAQIAGASEKEIADRLDGLALARGQTADVVQRRGALAAKHPLWRNVSQYAVALAESGRYEEADTEYVKALTAYRETSPFVVSWFMFVRGVLWAEKVGHDENGRL